jgi:hypothetical protein
LRAVAGTGRTTLGAVTITARVKQGLIAVLLAACGGQGGAVSSRPPTPEPLAPTCATRLQARALAAGTDSSALPPLPARGEAPAFAAPRSTLVVNAEVPLGGLRQALETKVPRRLAEERDHDLGMAGRLEYTVDRGPFAVRVEAGAVVVDALLHGRAQACAKGRCYAGCAPEARVTARVPLRLSADYKLRSSDVRVEVLRGCQVRALGGLVTVDVTPILRAALAQQTGKIQASIDRELPDFKPQAARLWAELAKPRELPLGMCVVLAPEAITQGPAAGTVESARLRFGLLARPELRVSCASGPGAAGSPPGSSPTPPLPPLRDDPALPALGDVHLAIVLGEDAPARAVERAAEVIDFGGRRGRVSKASGTAASLVIDLSGEVCGELVQSAVGVAWSEQQALHLVGSSPTTAGEGARLAAAGLDAALVASAVERAPMALPIALSALPTLLPELASAMSDASVTVSAAVESARPESAGLRGTDPIAVALLRGAVTLRAN